ncbi:MAG: hypothetical protein WCH39_03330 [Schlesneria sp.]
MTAPEFWLIAAAAFPILGAIGALTGILFQFPYWGFAVARTGLIGGCICSAILAILLYSHDFKVLPSVHVLMWPWFSMTNPRPISLVFGLQATWVKALLVSLFGGVVLAKHLSIGVQGGRSLSENNRLVDSLLCVAVTVFFYAPNLAQSLLGWLAISLLVSILIRLSRESVEHPQTRSGRFSVQRGESVVADSNRGIQRLAYSLSAVERFIQGRIWHGVGKSFPDWLGEQVEVIEESTVSFQIFATILGSFAVLLTWLIIV